MMLDDAGKIIEELKRRREENRLKYLEPYEWQVRFLNPKDGDGRDAKQVLLRAANQVGKTYIGGFAVAYHATGLYPRWWKGRRFSGATLIWVGGNTIPNTRDLCQAELLGEPGDPDDFGHGSIPKELIGRVTKYHGIPDACQSVLVKHVSGKWSKIIFKAFEQGKEAWMGKGVHYIWADEELPYDIYSQCLRATVKHNGILGITATPELGMTQVMKIFSHDITGKELGSGQALVTATWDDAPHLSEEAKEQRLAGMLPYERDMRSRGLPVMGSGLIFPVPEDDIICEPFAIPSGWQRIAGIDFAGSGSGGHPTALVAIAIDPNTSTHYVYDCYKEVGRTIPEHWNAMRRIGNIPIAWPHDGAVSDRGSGVSYCQQYRDEGANMLPKPFSNPSEDGKGGKAVNPGLTAMHTAMVEGRFKVFSNLQDWFAEFRTYHMKPNRSGTVEIVKENDDLMSATRYAFMSARYAISTKNTYEAYIPDEWQDAEVGY